MATRTVGGYKLIKALGKGSAATVYLVRSVDTQQEFAMKLLHPEEAAKPAIQKRFVREAVVLKRLRHPNIVSFIDCGVDDEHLYVVMELVRCGSLKSVLDGHGALPWTTAAKIAGQACKGLAYAHQEGVIHRDLKPGNLFLEADGHVKIGDFGLAQDLSLPRLTTSQAAIGTCRYMAPEQIRCEDPLTGSADLYALGAVLFQMIVGRPMFDGASHTEVFDQHLTAAPPVLIEHAPQCPQELSDLVARMVAKDAADRPARAEEVANALADILDRAPDNVHDKVPCVGGATGEPSGEELSLELLPDESEPN